MPILDEYTTNNYLTQNGISSDYLRQLSEMFNPPPAGQPMAPVTQQFTPPASQGETTPTEMPTAPATPEIKTDYSTIPESYDYGLTENPQVDPLVLEEIVRSFTQTLPTTTPTNTPTATPTENKAAKKLLAAAFVGGDYKISQGYGANKNSPLYRKLGGHEGVDIATPLGTTITAPFNGVVEIVGDRKSTPGWSNYGNWVRIRDLETGNSYDLAHLSAVNVKAGRTFKAGEVIGKTGNTGRSTGAHLHISVWKKGKRVNPMQ